MCERNREPGNRSRTKYLIRNKKKEQKNITIRKSAIDQERKIEEGMDGANPQDKRDRRNEEDAGISV